MHDTALALLRADLDLHSTALVHYDDRTGERTVLSHGELRNWAARTANLLHTERFRPGDLAALLLPPHWQTAAVFLGAWYAGLRIEYQGLGTSGLPRLHEQQIDVAFVAADQLFYTPPSTTRYVLRLGAAPGAAAPGFLEYLDEVRDQPARWAMPTGLRAEDAATVDGTTYLEWGRLATELARTLDLHLGDRVLIDAAEHDHPVKWLLAPLAAGATIILCSNRDPAADDGRRERDGITRIL